MSLLKSFSFEAELFHHSEALFFSFSHEKHNPSINKNKFAKKKDMYRSARRDQQIIYEENSVIALKQLRFFLKKKTVFVSFISWKKWKRS
jgi:hypothetical protein